MYSLLVVANSQVFLIKLEQKMKIFLSKIYKKSKIKKLK
jgi:hypothetical protein